MVCGGGRQRVAIPMRLRADYRSAIARTEKPLGGSDGGARQPPGRDSDKRPDVHRFYPCFSLKMTISDLPGHWVGFIAETPRRKNEEAVRVTEKVATVVAPDAARAAAGL